MGDPAAMEARTRFVLQGPRAETSARQIVRTTSTGVPVTLGGLIEAIATPCDVARKVQKRGTSRRAEEARRLEELARRYRGHR